MTALDADLAELERAGSAALASGLGADYYREHLTEDALMAFSFGVMSRRDAIDAMEAAPPWKSFEIEDPKVVALGDDCGVLVYRATAQRAGQEPYRAVISSTFVRRDGAWKLAFHQQTPVQT